jgi:hypothetical protein
LIVGRPGRESGFATDDGRTLIWMRVLRDGERIQAASFEGTTAVVEAEGASYLASFGIVGPLVP